MRRLNRHRRDDDGVVAITVTILAAVLLVMAAFSVDIGSAVAIARSAQNSADAAALAIATDCSRGAGASSPTPYLTNGQTATSTGCNGGSVTATVRRTKEWTLGKLVGLGSYTKTRQATAKWGALGSATGTFPITIGTCAFTIQFNIKVTLHSYAVPGCPNPSGQFGFIQGGCTSQTIVAGATIPGTTGNNLVGTGCNEASLNALLGKDVLIPVWDTAGGTGSNATYHVLAFAIFNFTGWSTNGTSAGGTLKKQCDASADGGTNENVNKPCVRGVFKGFTTQTGTVVPGLPCKENILACFVYLDR